MTLKKWIVRLRMWYADVRGHHGKRWDYEPGEWYMGRLNADVVGVNGTNGCSGVEKRLDRIMHSCFQWLRCMT